MSNFRSISGVQVLGVLVRPVMILFSTISKTATSSILCSLFLGKVLLLCNLCITASLQKSEGGFILTRPVPVDNETTFFITLTKNARLNKFYAIRLCERFESFNLRNNDLQPEKQNFVN